jgi:hypothetical protein
MAFSNKKLQPSHNLHVLLSPVVFDSVRSTEERTSNRKRKCYGSGNIIKKGDKYINHQFRYDGSIITVSFCKKYFYKGKKK